MQRQIFGGIRSIITFLGSIFITGLISLLPLTLTIALFRFSFRVTKSWLHPIYLLEPKWLQEVPFSEFILAILVILGVGLILNFLFLRPIFHFFEAAINNIPLIRPVYAGFKQLVQAFNPSDKESFKQVVIIEFPRQEIYSIGFVTSEIGDELKPENSQNYYTVFIPTTPMPTNGYLLIVRADQIKKIDLSRQEAMALIISGGIVKPERFLQR